MASSPPETVLFWQKKDKLRDAWKQLAKVRVRHRFRHGRGAANTSRFSSTDVLSYAINLSPAVEAGIFPRSK